MNLFVNCTFTALFLLWFAIGPSFMLRAQPFDLPAPQRLTEREGLPQAYVPAIVQDRQGFIWAATRDGLCRYDGDNFKVFQPDPDGRPSLSYAGISNLTLDHCGRIWIGSERGDIDVLDPLTETFVNISRQPAYEKATMGRRVTFFLPDRQDRLWVVLADEGEIFRYDFRNREAKRFFFGSGKGTSFRSDTVTDLTEGTDGRIWLATHMGLKYLDPETDRFRGYKLPASQHDYPRRLYALPGAATRDELLVFYAHELIRLQWQVGTVESYPHQADDFFMKKRNFVSDAQGRAYFNNGNTLYGFTKRDGVQALARRAPKVPANHGMGLWVDRSGVLWEGTGGAGIRKYDLTPNPFRAVPYRNSFYADLRRELGLDSLNGPPTLLDPKNKLDSYLFRYTIDGKKRLWYSVGVADIRRLDWATRRVSQRTLPTPFPYVKGDHIPFPLATDPEGKVWAIHQSIAWKYSEDSARWVRFPHPIPNQETSGILQFTVDRQALWLATQQKALWRLDRKTGQMRQFAHRPGDPRSLSNDALFCISDDPDDPDRLWVGTFGGGLCAFDKRTGYFRRFTVADGLPNNVIYSVIPDAQGYLWMGTNKGICQMNRRTFATTTYTQAQGLLANEFNRFHWLKLPDARIVMGGLEGITAFYPGQVKKDTFDVPVELTKIRVNNKPVSPALTDSLPAQAVKKLVLDTDQNFLAVEFAALQFNGSPGRRSAARGSATRQSASQRPGNNRYRYRLEGLEDDWTETDRPVAIYTNLPPGKYKLWLNASNTSGKWSKHERRLNFRIRRPAWTFWWAYLIYAFVAAGLAWLGGRMYLNRLKLRQALALQKQTLALREREVALKAQEAEQLRTVDKMKSDFFANITHEFRTPLTLILGPTEQLYQEADKPQDRQRLSAIDRNAHQLLGLVNQLLDLSKLEAGALPIVEQRGDLAQFVAQTIDAFRELATARGVELDFRAENLAKEYWFDADKLRSVLNNLLANALNYGREGPVEVVLSGATSAGPGEAGVKISVADTGPGISADELPRIFDRYYRVRSAGESAPKTGKSAPAHRPVPQPQGNGTGLGLALVRELVNLQRGEISVTSEVGCGSVFVVKLPYRTVEEQKSTSPGSESKTAPDQVPASGASANRGQALVLVVEDHDELARYITESLPADYRVQRASDGQQGWEMALAELPDLILSDVMMPVMDGYALCQKLKTDLRTSHIPVLLLTAKASPDNRLEGLERGADDYLPKPFRVDELRLRIRNRLAQRQRLRERLRAELSQPAETNEVLAETTDPFLRKIYVLLEKQLDDPKFGVAQLLEPLGMSRPTLYRKLKALTDMSPSEVMLLYRLRRAAHFLRQGASATDTAYRVGFQTPSHFTKMFRAKYQMTPSEFARQKGES